MIDRIEQQWIARVCLLAVALLATIDGNAFGNSTGTYPGQVLKTFPFPAADIVLHPTKPLMFASVSAGIYPNETKVAVINTESWSVVSMLEVGLSPKGLAMTPDGSELYVAVRGTDKLAVMDTESFQVDLLPMGVYAADIAYDARGRLWITGSFDGGYKENIYEINPDTGIPTGSALFPASSYYLSEGLLEISNDRTKLYYGTTGTSACTYFQYDVGGVSPSYMMDGGNLGGSGIDIALSRDGDLISFAAAGGNRIHQRDDLAIIHTDDASVVGAINVGSLSRAVTYSPDAAFTYVAVDYGMVKVFNNETLDLVDQWRWKYDTYLDDETRQLLVDSTGKYLFVGTASELLVLSTGRSVQVPEPKGIIVSFTLLGILSRKKSSL